MATKKKRKKKSWRKRRFSLLVRLSEAQNHRCCHCGSNTVLILHEPYEQQCLKNEATLEHVIPLKYKPLCPFFGWNNLAMACALCNNSRQVKNKKLEWGLIILVRDLFGREMLGNLIYGE